MDGTILVNYDEVTTLTQALRTNMQSDILTESQNRYSDIAEAVKRVDGAANAGLITTTELTHQKTAAVCEALEKLITYVQEASQDLQDNEREMAGEIQAGARG